MRLLLLRHGEANNNIGEVGESQLSLTQQGWKQAINVGETLLKEIYADPYSKPIVYLSPYMRTQQTCSGALLGAGEGIKNRVILREDSRLIERYLGGYNLPELSSSTMDASIADQFKRTSDCAYDKDPFTARPLFGESNKDNLLAIKNFLDGTFSRDIQRGYNDFLFVTHGATIKNILLLWSNIPMNRRSHIPAVQNCDVISISGTFHEWKVSKIYDGPTGKPVNDDFLKGLQPYSIQDLPKVPDNIQAQYDQQGRVVEFDAGPNEP